MTLTEGCPMQECHWGTKWHSPMKDLESWDLLAEEEDAGIL